MSERGFLNIGMRQSAEAIPAFDKFFRIEKFDRIIELGTGNGGLTLFLGLYCLFSDCELYSFDQEDKRADKIKSLLKRLPVKFYQRDIWKSADFISALIEENKKTLLLCDNGNKNREFKTYSDCLKPDDFIMIHDYVETKNSFRNYYKKNDIWDSCEITWFDIENIANENHIEPQIYDIFTRSGWFVGEKMEYSEVKKIREEAIKFITPEMNGIDIGSGGAPVLPQSISLDRSYKGQHSHSIQLKGDAKKLYWFNDEVLDYVFSSHCLEDFPIEEKKEVLAEWLRVIRTEGLLLLYLPDERKYRKFCEAGNAQPNKAHEDKNFNIETVLNLVNDNFSNKLKEIHRIEEHGDYCFFIVFQKI